jgi:hypothetical protein
MTVRSGGKSGQLVFLVGASTKVLHCYSSLEFRKQGRWGGERIFPFPSILKLSWATLRQFYPNFSPSSQWCYIVCWRPCMHNDKNVSHDFLCYVFAFLIKSISFCNSTFYLAPKWKRNETNKIKSNMI